jgi:hypothetical protein
MSIIRNNTTRSRDIPLNELETNLALYNYDSSHGWLDNPYNANARSGDEPYLEQHQYNDEPIQQVDTYYNNLYRSTIERLKTQTETWNDYHNAGSVPFYIEDCAVQCDDDLEIPNPLVFTLEDHKAYDDQFTINRNIRRMTFKLNFNPFKSDSNYFMKSYESEDESDIRNRFRFINGFIHIVSSYLEKPTEQNPDGVFESINDLKRFLDFPTADAIKLSKLNDNIFVDSALTVSDEEYYTLNGDSKLYPGTIINTGVKCTQKKLYDLGIIKPFLFCLDGYPMNWNRTIISCDRNDIFVSFILDDTANFNVFENGKISRN